jgi:hypothetical protein
MALYSGVKMTNCNDDELVTYLKEIDLSEYANPKDLSQRDQALWMLYVLKEKAKIKKASAKTISHLLAELRELILDEKTIIRGFARSGNKIKVHKEGGTVSYEIMVDGKEIINNLIDTRNEKILFFSGENSWTDSNMNFPKIISLLKGDLSLVDPFYGDGTFFVLEKFGKQRKIRFLTSTLGRQEQENETNFKINLTKFKTEFKNIQLRKHNKPFELHDRYIIADNALVVIGHGIKDLGSKESFLIYFPIDSVKEFVCMLQELFNKRWSIASVI